MEFINIRTKVQASLQFKTKSWIWRRFFLGLFLRTILRKKLRKILVNEAHCSFFSISFLRLWEFVMCIFRNCKTKIYWLSTKSLNNKIKQIIKTPTFCISFHITWITDSVDFGQTNNVHNHKLRLFMFMVRYKQSYHNLATGPLTLDCHSHPLVLFAFFA